MRYRHYEVQQPMGFKTTTSLGTIQIVSNLVPVQKGHVATEVDSVYSSEDITIQFYVKIL